VAQRVAVVREVRRVLRDDGTLWLNLGDSYNAGTTKPSGASKSADVGGWTTRSGDAAGARRVTASDSKVKDLMGIPWMVAFALRADGWYLRQDIIWSKPNPMPESVRDRCTKAHEYLFLLSKSPRYYYDIDAIAEPLAAASIERLSQPNIDQQAGSDRVPGKTNGAMKAVGPRFGGSKYGDDESGESRTKSGNEWAGSETGKRNKRSVWEVATQPFKEAHFATFPPALIEPCILAGSREGDTVLDPFGGAGTTGLVADRHRRDAILCELNPAYAEIARNRITGDAPLFAEVAA
jgi:DNA modification methylase